MDRQTQWPTILIALLVPAFLVAQPTLEQTWELGEGLDRPESVIYHKDTGALYVSNIKGSPSVTDGNGYLSTVSLEGHMLEEKWVTGLDAPKGMAIYGDTLYVSDITNLVAIEIPTGTILKRYPASGAKFLNDVAADRKGRVYVSDSGAGILYRLVNGELDVWLKTDAVTSPNGIYTTAGNLIVAAADGDAGDPGSMRYLKQVNYKSKKVRGIPPAEPIGGLDGVESDGRDGYFLTGWIDATVWHFLPGEGATVLREISQGTADIDYIHEKNLLLLPVMMSNQLIAFRVIF